ncbi:MAG: spermidine synthase, partial [Phycisphaerales bacterium]
MFIYAIAIFLSAALLFVIQPLTGKLLLPLLGGSPGVWNTCMVFFQAALLAGYLYSHLLSKVKSIVAQAGIHVAVVAATWLVLPIALSSTQPAEFSPTAWLLETLLKTVGLPFF